MRSGDALAVINMNIKEVTDAEASRHVREVCDARPLAGWRHRCAIALKQHVAKLPISSTRFYLNSVIRSTPLAGDR